MLMSCRLKALPAKVRLKGKWLFIEAFSRCSRLRVTFSTSTSLAECGIDILTGDIRHFEKVPQVHSASYRVHILGVTITMFRCWECDNTIVVVALYLKHIYKGFGIINLSIYVNKKYCKYRILLFWNFHFWNPSLLEGSYAVTKDRGMKHIATLGSSTIKLFHYFKCIHYNTDTICLVMPGKL